MDEDNKVVAETRDSFGKGAARRLRVAGRVPAVIYGHGSETQHVSLPAHQTSLLLRRANALLNIEIEGKSQLTLVKDVQKDPVRQIIEHIDLVAVRQGEKVDVEVPVHLVGEPFPGSIAMLEVATLRLQVEATHIPENVKVEIEGAHDGTLIHAKDIELPRGAVLADEPDLLIVNIAAPAATRVDAEAEEAAEAPAAE